MTIRIKRAYEVPARTDGVRVLVDHLWPRGLKKEALKVERWVRSVSPSNPLRTWFGHEPAKWQEFQRRYFAELDRKPDAWAPLLESARTKDLTLVFGARHIEHNNAAALKTYLEEKLAPRTRGKRVNPRNAGASNPHASYHA